MSDDRTVDDDPYEAEPYAAESYATDSCQARAYATGRSETDPYGIGEYAEVDELADFEEFLRVCAELTGFDVPELRATGMAHEHHRTVLAHRVRDEHALVHLWYVGAWPGEAPSSARAHDQGLLWRTFHAGAPGAAAPGHGSWAEAPRGGEER
ncbi:hypothetical protein ACGF12_10315 [Kitasatospora sp. NPDC048296]|uniref:hypothetical protein n=1 Tax=Kitasatospora sp. NPDC048296 TaxID=3364048 RepID=UPI003714B54D